MHRQELIRLVDLYRTRVNRAEATISNWIFGNARVFNRLRKKLPVTDRIYERGFQWFSDHWPADLAWPEDIPRPAPSEKETANA